MTDPDATRVNEYLVVAHTHDCGTMYSAEAEMCNRCGMAFTLHAAMKKDDGLAETNKRIDHLMELLKRGATPDPKLLNVKSSDLK